MAMVLSSKYGLREHLVAMSQVCFSAFEFVWTLGKIWDLKRQRQCKSSDMVVSKYGRRKLAPDLLPIERRA